MSLNEDLARNRAVFERLVGGVTREPDVDAGFTPARNLSMDIPVYEGSSLSPAPVIEEKPEKIESFSLSRGTVRRTSMSLEPPGSADAPALRESERADASDPLDRLYHQLEVEARRSSQLLGEGDYFE